MAKTICSWKKIFIHKFKEKGFNFFGWFDTIYEVLFKKKLSDDHETVWFNAYVNLEEPLKEKYEFESYRHNNIVGCDTSDHASVQESGQKKIIAFRIKAIINEHHEKA